MLDLCADLAVTGPSRLGHPVRYGIACALVAIATVVRFAYAPQEAGLPYVTYFPAATLAAIIGGVGPAITGTLLSCIVAAYLFIPPFGALKIEPFVIASAALFCVEEIIVCAAIEAMRRYHRRYDRAMNQLRQAHASEHAARLSAEQANVAKSRFLAAASHDLRQPYQALRLFLAALQTPSLPQDKVSRAVEGMDVALTAGEELLKALMELSTLEAGLTTPKPQSVGVRDLLQSIEAAHAPVALAKGLSFRVRAFDVDIRTDPVLLGRILGNLASNAVRYTHTGGILLACRRRRGAVAFEVWDTGIGIAPEHREAVFEEFFQVGNVERDRAKGAGLGLAVVRRSTDLLGGKIGLESVPGRGTRFHLTLPIEPPVAGQGIA